MDTRINTRNISIDILRGFAAMLMILGHSFIVYPVDISQVEWCSRLGHWIYTFHMELFFVLAGAVYKYRGYRSLLKGKTKRILVPYLFFGLATLLLRVYGGSLVNGNEDLGAGLKSLMLYGGGYWFLYTLFIIFLVYPLLNRLPEFVKLIAAAVLILSRYFIPYPSLFSIHCVVCYLPYFIAGHVFFHHIYEGSRMKGTTSLKAVILALTVFFYLVLDRIVDEELSRYICVYLRAFAMITVCCIVLDLLMQLTSGTDNSTVMWLRNLLCDCGRYSLQLYLFNGYILTVTRIILCNVFGVRSPVVLVSVIWAANIVITLLVCKYLIPVIPGASLLTGLAKKQK